MKTQIIEVMKNWIIFFALLSISSLFSKSVSAYPGFIGIGYANCMTCHYNPHGNGQLNDYGKALFATEIAAKPFWKPNVTDEELSQTSGFFFNEPQPRMFRPSIKFRELYLTTSPGGDNSFKRYVMQGDLGIATHFDENDKYILVLSAGYTPRAINANIKEGAWNYRMISREHYLRIQMTEEQFLSVGLIDIAYGLRLVDHTSANRKGIGLDQNSQVHGILYNYFTEKLIFGAHAFVGNQFRDEIARIKGFSTTAEYTIADKTTFGGSVLVGETTVNKQTTYGILSRKGIGAGSSLMGEFGFNKIEPKSGGDAQTGSYGVLVGTMKLQRGLDFETQLEYIKSDLKEASPETYKYGFGLVYWPFQRMELRILAQDSRTISPTEVKGDTWGLQTQWHLSL